MFKSNARETWCVILVSESWHILLRITAHPRGAFISVGDWTPTEKDLLLLTTCRSGSLNSDWDESVFGQPQLPKILHYTNLVAQKMLYWPNCQYSIFYLYDIYLQNFIQNQCLSVTIQFLTFDSRKSDSLNSTFAFRLALIKFLRTTISLSSNFVCDSFSLSVLGQALKRLVTVSSMCCHTSTSALSTSYSSRVFTPLKGWDISSWGGLHA